jgi:hypothetical protein
MPHDSSSDPIRRFSGATVRVAAAAACVALATAVAVPARADETASSGAGMRVYVDPKTGEILENPPADARARERASEAPSTAPADDADVVVEPAPGGGVMVDVGDRQQHEMQVTVGADGAPKTRCLQQPDGASGAR